VAQVWLHFTAIRCKSAVELEKLAAPFRFTWQLPSSIFDDFESDR